MTNNDFSQIYAKNYTDTVNYIDWRINDLQTAQDLAQDVFVKVLRYLETFDESKSKLASWLRNITNRVIIDYYRTNQYGKNCVNVTEFDDEETGLSFQFVDKNASADCEVISNEKKAKIRKAFDSLNEGKERLIAHLFFIDEFEYNEISELTMYPMGTVKGMINRIRTKLQSELTQCSINY